MQTATYTSPIEDNLEQSAIMLHSNQMGSDCWRKDSAALIVSNEEEYSQSLYTSLIDSCNNLAKDLLENKAHLSNKQIYDDVHLHQKVSARNDNKPLQRP